MSMNLVFKDRRFRPLFWTQFCGALNDNYFKNALVMLITYKGIEMWSMASKDLVAMAAGIFILPFFLFSATAGQIADKYQKADIIRITKITELIIMCLATLGLFFESYELLILILFLMGSQSAFFGPLKYGIIPQLIKKEELVSGNAYVSTGTMIAILLGTIIGGQVIGNIWVLTSGLILFSLAGIYFSRGIQDVPILNSNIKVDYTLFKPSWQILKLTLSDKNILKSILGISWFWFIGAAILSLIPAFSKEVFMVDKLVANFFLGTFTIGVGIGAVITDKISTDKVEIGVVPLAGVGISLFLMDLYFVGSGWPMSVTGELVSFSSFFQMDNSFRAFFDLLMISVCGGMFSVPQLAFIQQESRREVLAQTIAGTNIWNALFMVVASILIIVFYGIGFSIPEVAMAFATMNFIVAIILFFCHSEYTWRVYFVILTRVFYRFEIEGQENIPKDGPYVISSNHVSFVDWAFIMGSFPHPVRFLIDHSYYKTKWAHFWFSQCGLIPIATKRESQEILAKAWAGVSKAVEDGHVLGIFPEGWVSRDGKLRKFQPGVAKIVSKDKTMVLPVLIEGLWGSFFSYSGKGVMKKMPLFRRRVKLTVFPPMKAEEFELQKLEAIYSERISEYPEKI